MATAQIAEMRSAQPARPLATMKPKEQIAYLLEQKKGELAKMLPKTLSIDRLLKVAQIAATTTPALAKCDVASLVGAIGQCAQMGLEPNTVLGHAYLVPFNTKRKMPDGSERWVNSVQVIIGYKGLIDLARRSGQIVSIAAHEVCKNDHFELVYGLDEKLNHTPSMDVRGDVIGFYAVAKLKDGGHCCEFMSTHQVREIMVATQSKGNYGPWKDHFVEMGRKTVIRRLAKYLPLSIEFQTAVALDGMAETGKDQRLDTVDGDFTFLPDDAPGVDPETGEVLERLTESVPVDIPQQAFKHAEKDVAVKGAPQAQQAASGARAERVAENWEPSAEEVAAIQATEIAEAQGTAAAAPTARRARAAQANIE
jgi:recombination protein RecT